MAYHVYHHGLLINRNKVKRTQNQGKLYGMYDEIED